MPLPFEVPFGEIERDLDLYVDEVFSCLKSDFMTLPKSPGFVEYSVFERGYESLKRATRAFRDLSADTVLRAVYDTPIILIVLRCMLGFSPPEWAYVALPRNGVDVTQGAA